MTFHPRPVQTWTVAALALVAGCGGSPTPLSPSTAPRGAAPSGQFSVLRSSPVHATAEFPASTASTAAPCTPLPDTTTAPGATPTGTPAAEPAAAPSEPTPSYGGYYSLNPGRIRAFAEAAPAAAPCATVQITIAGTIGPASFSPNPTPAQVGDQIVWANNDLRPHRIIIDDGTPTGLMVGDLLPGATSAPFALTTATANYHCEYHPSMVETITAGLGTSVPGAMPGEGAAPASADPAYTPPADPGSYGAY